jgi:murein DD-endopeptidase MepM/ murein hydrolase activator NlpD
MKRMRIASVAALALAAILPSIAFAQSATSTQAADIQRQIDESNAQLSQLNADIAQYQKQLDAVSSKKQTLQTQLDQLNLSIKKVTTTINATKAQIRSTELQIQQLADGIGAKQSSISVDQAGLADALRSLNRADDAPLVLQLLGADSISSVWQDVETLQSLQSAVNDRIALLSSEKRSLADTKTQQEQKRVQLVRQQTALLEQQGSLNATKQAQSDLLAQTKNQETNYQAIINQKKAQEQAMEDALTNLKSQYNVTINPSEVPPIAKGILQWPLDTVRITQYFGNTAFAQSGAYNGKGHNGIDFAASIGTPVHAALGGVVIGTGNTDAIHNSKGQQCYSFGKWVMVQHGNGLSTMYAHFSQISVNQGQQVSTGQLLGYSGETGYATGPHLHFGVYLSSATHIIQLGQATNADTPCATAVMPVAPLSGYLNPLNYLPAQ